VTHLRHHRPQLRRNLVLEGGTIRRGATKAHDQSFALAIICFSQRSQETVRTAKIMRDGISDLSHENKSPMGV
ncbi:MAG: hypothetical protein INH13_03330, partial [Cupriavidus sp.]|nr:hypothetical protein [Cupriavidus sp.]